jgi:hypothetical protein
MAAAASTGMTAQQPAPASSEAAGSQAAGNPAAAAEGHSHDFDVQKELHQQIRNDPDYDDWEYGTEPLPHEAWLKKPTA